MSMLMPHLWSSACLRLIFSRCW